MEFDVKALHPLEIKLLRYIGEEDEITSDRIMQELSYKLGQCNQVFSWLTAKKFITEAKRTAKVYYEITDLGMEYKTKGIPEKRIIDFLKTEGPQKMSGIASGLGLQNKDVGSAFGQLSKDKILKMDSEKNVVVISDVLPDRARILADLLARAVDKKLIDDKDLSKGEREVIRSHSKKRGASASPFKTVEREEVVYMLTEHGKELKKYLLKNGVTGDEIGSVTPEILASGTWKGKNFREYNINIPPNRVLLGRRNPYGEYLQWVKDKLSSLGFEEFDGPLVENEFWNGDALFMPQFHSARDIHDVYYIKHPSHAKKIEQPYLDQVAATHENGWKTGSRGWGYTFDHEFTRRQVMRSQGTVLSAKQLHKASVPGKYFGVVRCFRYDQVDATHGADFYQTEGIVLGEDVNLRTLLGLLKMFAEEVAGAEEVKYVPGYFPFTEPSIEVHIKHPVLGWFELGGSGIFRPEVTKAMGIEVPVLAWGLGIDRMALMHLGLNDLRELFTPDIESVRLRRKN